LGNFTPATIGQWEGQLSSTIFKLVAGTSYTITFQGLDSFPPDATAFIDDLVLNIPEPVSLALFGSGLVAAGLLRRRKRQRT
jgi:hypothetical protein